MTKAKSLLIAVLMIATILFIPNISNADNETVTRNVYSNNGSMKFSFEGLTLDTTHEYSFGLTATSAAEVTTWHTITEYTATTAVVDIVSTTDDLRDVIDATDTGYITIKDITDDTIILSPYQVDLKMPLLQVSNYTVLDNGTENTIYVELRNASNSTAYYKYEEITDETLISKYKELKENNGDYLELEDYITTSVPTTGWINWSYWNGHGGITTSGEGYPERTISVPDSGLYYMWIYFSGDGIKNIYGCIIIDNLEAEVSLQGISLTSTATLELGDTLTLTPTFNPSTATNKAVTWTSSNEAVATVSNAGVITPVSVGTTLITVTSEDGDYSATCTVTVTEQTSSSGTTTNTTTTDTTVATGTLPKAGLSFTLVIAILFVVSIGIITYKKFNNLKDIK